ncbi:MAG: Mo-dependent nitrogenase C-terminal domain-containing protein, partial [Elainellaceae cyanobacterium]
MNNLSPQSQGNQSRLRFLNPIRNWLDDFEICDPKVARLISRTIPAQCPFERDVKVFGLVVAHIPPLC